MDKVNVRYIVNDVDAAIRFYTDMLGFKLEMHPAPGFASLSKGNLNLLLNKPGAGGAGTSMGDGRVPAPGGWSRFQIEVDDIAATVAKLKNGGGAFRSDIIVGNGGKQILIDDPSGNCIELFEPFRGERGGAGAGRGAGRSRPGGGGSPDAQAAGDEAQRVAMRAAARRMDRVNDWLHLGGAVPADEYGRFSDAGVTHIVDLREDTEVDTDLARLESLGIARRQVPVPNFGVPSAAQLAEVADWLETQGEDMVVYVHCGGGFGRAATMAVGLLMLKGLDVDEAVGQVRSVRPEIRINEAQFAWLREIEVGRRR